MNWRALFAALTLLTMATPALAKEQINRFDVAIDVGRNGDVIITETIEVNAEGDRINHGIFRDLPRFYERDGDRLPYQYNVQRVSRDGLRERYETEDDENALRVRIGDPDKTVSPGVHTYEIRYRVRNQVRYLDDHDEIYWNATGNYWAFPIAHVRATISLPPGARVTSARAYTGALGATGADYSYEQIGAKYLFETTRPLGVEEGLTVAIGVAKGVIDPPSTADLTWLWWQRNGALAALLASLGALFWFLYRAYQRVGRDPQKDPVFPRYEAPEGYSPAAVHHIYYRGLQGHRALIATLMNLAVKGRVTIDASDSKVTELSLNSDRGAITPVAGEDMAFESGIFRGARVKSLGARYDDGFTKAYTEFKAQLSAKYGSPYFRWNTAYSLIAIAVTIGVIIYVSKQAMHWTVWHTFGVLALAAMNAVFLYLMPAPTPEGQKLRTEIEGFRLYMEKAEKLQLNATDITGATPPPMTTERYEKFLPYAVALGVEEPWTKHFQRLMPTEAAAYSPAWGSMGSHSFTGMSSAMVSHMSSGVSSALPQSSSSSGSGGGGSSGGGGGGGGGGGW